MLHKIRYFHNGGVGSIIALSAVVAIEAILAIRVWYMVYTGITFVHVDILEQALAWVISPIIAGIAIYAFMHVEYAVEDAKAYDLEHGRYMRIVVYADNSTRNERYNVPPRWIYSYWLVLIVIGLEAWSIFYGSAADGLGSDQYVRSVGFFLTLAIVPFIIGKMLYASVNRPVSVYKKQRERERELNVLAEEEGLERARKKTGRMLAPPDASSGAIAKDAMQQRQQGASAIAQKAQGGNNSGFGGQDRSGERFPTIGAMTPQGGNNSRSPDGM